MNAKLVLLVSSAFFRSGTKYWEKYPDIFTVPGGSVLLEHVFSMF